MAADLPQRQQVLLREVAPQRQRRVQARRRVALGQHETIPVLPLGVLGVDAQFLKVKVRKQVRRGQAAAGMPGLGRVDAP